MLTIKDFPTVEELARAMEHLLGRVEPEYRESKDDTPHIDVRLQVWSEEDGDGWTIHTGDASYDQDHRAYWGAGCVTADDTLDTLKALANEMIEKAIEQAAQNDDFEDTDGDPEESPAIRLEAFPVHPDGDFDIYDSVQGVRVAKLYGNPMRPEQAKKLAGVFVQAVNKE